MEYIFLLFVLFISLVQDYSTVLDSDYPIIPTTIIHYKIITKFNPIFGPKLESSILTKRHLFTTQMLAMLQLHFN